MNTGRTKLLFFFHFSEETCLTVAVVHSILEPWKNRSDEEEEEQEEEEEVEEEEKEVEEEEEEVLHTEMMR